MQIEIPLRAPRSSVVRVLTDAESISRVSLVTTTTVEALRRDQVQSTLPVHAADSPTVLVVEDHAEMRRFIAGKPVERLSGD